MLGGEEGDKRGEGGMCEAAAPSERAELVTLSNPEVGGGVNPPPPSPQLPLMS